MIIIELSGIAGGRLTINPSNIIVMTWEEDSNPCTAIYTVNPSRTLRVQETPAEIKKLIYQEQALLAGYAPAVG